MQKEGLKMFRHTDVCKMICAMKEGDFFYRCHRYFQVIKIGDVNSSSIVYDLTRGKLMPLYSFYLCTVCELVD